MSLLLALMLQTEAPECHNICRTEYVACTLVADGWVEMPVKYKIKYKGYTRQMCDNEYDKCVEKYKCEEK